MRHYVFYYNINAEIIFIIFLFCDRFEQIRDNSAFVTGRNYERYASFFFIGKKEFESYEAFVVVDADAVLAPDYMTELNNALEYDKDVYNTRKLIKNYNSTLSHH